MITKAIVKILGDASISGGRIHASRAPDNELLPYIRINQRMDPERCHTGIVQKNYAVQIDIFSKKYKEAAEISEEILNTLEGFSGIVQGIDIRDIQFSDESNGFEDQDDIEQKIIEFDVQVNT